MARANVAGSIQASKAHRSNPYLTLTAPGVIKAQYDAKAGEQLGDAIGEGITALGQGVLQLSQWQNYGKPMADLQMENSKLMNEKLDFENTKLKLDFGSQMLENKATYIELNKNNPNALSFEDNTKAIIDMVDRMTEGVTNVPKSETRTNGVVHEPYTGSSTSRTSVSSSDNDSDVSDINVNTESNTTQQPMSLNTVKNATESLKLYNQNFSPAMQNFFNHVQKTGNIDRDYNPDEYGIYNSIIQNQDNPNWRPEVGLNDKNESVVRFTHVDGKDENDEPIVKTTEVLMSRFRQSDGWWSPLQIPETHTNFLVSNKERMPTFVKEYGSSQVISETGWKEFSTVFEEEKGKGTFMKSMNRNLGIISDGKVTAITDADDDGDITAADYRKLAEPFLMEGRKTVDQLSFEQGRQSGIVAEGKKTVTEDTPDDKKKKSLKIKNSAYNTIGGASNEITEAISSGDTKLLGRLTGTPPADITFTRDEDNNITGFETVQRDTYGRGTISGTYSLNNNNDLKDLTRASLKLRGSDAYKGTDPYIDGFFDDKTKVTETVNQIEDQTIDGETVLGRSEAKIKNDFGVKNIHELPPQVQTSLVKRQSDRGGFDTRTSLLSYLDIEIPKETDLSVGFSKLSEELQSQLRFYKPYWFSLKKQ